ncbi:hypothetical protein SS50377_22699 [Spironucleus salmonicida]|uniref:Uncharacterized protein n=1 Tax=Spironucleus salmonicida TaxID=348837 RepID=A0A9P8RZX8_9EUKA|nr:hypothetical protein SS50377_22688 [Spironucleus salmonicida]KAH0575077.1 hypothetical protein SS50377_22699 [Spironucleus salmonicida]
MPPNRSSQLLCGLAVLRKVRFANATARPPRQATLSHCIACELGAGGDSFRDDTPQASCSACYSPEEIRYALLRAGLHE